MSQGYASRTIYRFGNFEVDCREGLLRKGGVRIRIQPQPFAILVTLLQHPGELVTREDLRNRLWPSDTFVDFEKGLNAAMTRLRYAIGDSATTPRYIVTEARLGYRFVAPVQNQTGTVPNENLDSPADEAVQLPESGAGRSATPWVWTKTRASIVAGAILVCVWLAYMIGRSGSPPPAAVLEQITHDLGLATDPAVSQDGKLVAFASDRSGDRNKEGPLNLWVRQLAAGGSSVPLTHFDRDAHQPAFSPDGIRIVFRVEGESGGLYVVPSIGGEPVRLTTFGRNPRYSPDGRWIAFWLAIDSTSDPDPSGEVYLMSASGGDPQKIGPADSAFPVWSPDSRSLLVVKGRPEPEADWWTVPIDGGEPRRTGAFARLAALNFSVELGSMPQPAFWDGETVIFTGRNGDSQNIWRARLSAGSGRIQDPVERVTTGTARESAPTVTSSGQILFASLTEHVGIWSLPRDRAAGKPEKLTLSTRNEISPSVTPDGRYVIYSASNAKNLDIHLKDLRTGRDTVLSASPTPEWHPQISRDGSRAAYTDRAADGGIYVKTLPEGAAEKVSKSRAYVWDWSADNSRLLFNKSKADAELWSVQFPSKESSLYLRREGHPIYQAKFSPDNRWLSLMARRSGSTAIFAVPLENGVPAPGKPWVPIVDEGFWADKPRWAPDGASLYFVSHRDGYRCLWLQRLDPRTKRPIGTPVAVEHYHSARRSLLNVSLISMEYEVTQDRIFTNLGEVTGNIWSIRTDRETGR